MPGDTRYTPKTEFCDAIAAGRMLLLSPWPFVENKGRCTRQEAMQLNKLADAIAEE